MKHNYLLCFILVCFVLFCYYYTPESQVVEGLDSKSDADKDDTERYAFRDEKGYGAKGGILGGLFDVKPDPPPPCGGNELFKTSREVLQAAKTSNGMATGPKLNDPTCYKDIKCTDLLEEKQAACIPAIPHISPRKCAGLSVNMKGFPKEDKSSGDKSRKGAEIMKNCIKGSKAEHKGMYYLGNINGNYLHYLIEGLFGGCYVDLRSNVNEAFYYALDKVDEWKCDGLSGTDNYTCKAMDLLDSVEYMFTAQDRVKCGLEVTKNDLIRKL